MKNVLPSFPLNHRDVECLAVASLLSLLELLSFVNTGDGKRAELLVTIVVKQTHVGLWPADRTQNGEISIWAELFVCMKYRKKIQIYFFLSIKSVIVYFLID